MIRLGRISYVNMAPVFYRLDAEVEEIQGVPTELNRRVLAGELDAIAPPAEGQAMAAAIPGGRFLTIDGAGHLTPMEQPKAVAALIEKAAQGAVQK